MSTKRISFAIERALNQQATNEAYAAQVYLAYGIWADGQGFAGISDFLYRHVAEERDHMMKFIHYVQQRGGHARVSALDEPPSDPSSLEECFNALLEHEVKNTEAIYELVNLAHEEKDWITWNFAQWFVQEQNEEETLIMELIDQLKIAGGPDASGEALLYLDSQIGEMENDAELAREVEVDGE